MKICILNCILRLYRQKKKKKKAKFLQSFTHTYNFAQSSIYKEYRMALTYFQRDFFYCIIDRNKTINTNLFLHF